MLSACAETDSGAPQSKATLKNFETNLLELNGVANKTTSLNFQLSNIGDAELTYQLIDTADWLEIAPAAGSIAPEADRTVTFTATCPAAGSPPQTIVDLKTNDLARPNTNIFVSLKCVADQDVEVPDGKASLTFNVTGVPAEVHTKQDAFINVYGPDAALVDSVGQGQLVIETAGSYTIKADDITDSATNTLYKAPAEFKVIVTETAFNANSIPAVTVTYVKHTEPVIMADLNITVDGLPEGVNANVEVQDANATILATLTQSGKFTVQEAGSYKVLAHDVTHNNITYKAPAAIDVAVSQADLEQDTIAPVAVSYENPALVQNTNDNGPGSLRAVLAAIPAGATITFAPNVQTIALTSGPIALTQNVTIDGSRKVTLTGNEEHQIFTITTPIEVTLRGLTFTLAHAKTSNGGVISNEQGTLSLENSLFHDNDSEQNGGAIASKNGILNIINSTFTNNSAVLGGAIYSDSNDTKILFSTISENIASSGGGIAAANAAADTKTVQIGKSIVADNLDASDLAPDLLTSTDAQPFVSLGHNLIGNNTGAQGFTNALNNDQVGDNTTPINPILGGIASNDSAIGTMSVSLTSPAYASIPAADCVDANNLEVSTDQRGNARPTHGFCDIGAFERGADAPIGFESFDLSSAAASYGSSSFEGNQNITWNFIQARNAATAPIAGGGLNLRHHLADDEYGAVFAENIPGGIKEFSVKLRKGASGAGARQVELFINDVSHGKSQLFGSGSGADDTIHTFTVTDINVAGDFKLEIRHSTAGTSSNGRQIAVDNITWTAFP